MLTQKSQFEWNFASDEEEWQEFAAAHSAQKNVADAQRSIWQSNRTLVMLLSVILVVFTFREVWFWRAAQVHLAQQEDEIRAAVEMDTLAIQNDAQIVLAKLVAEEADEFGQQSVRQEPRQFVWSAARAAATSDPKTID